MARPLRLELAGGLYHVTSRGDRRENIYENDEDREKWLDNLGNICRRFNWSCHAYCLMDNHYHIVIETAEANLSKGMRQLNGVYTQYYNRQHGRVGHVFQGRYKGILVERDEYLLELARYVVLNPIRAGMIKNLKDWKWSSYKAMIGEEAAQSWLEAGWVLGQFSKQRKRAIEKYVDFVREGVGLPRIWGNLQNQIFLGSEKFINNILKQINDKETLSEVPWLQRRKLPKPLEYYDNTYHDPKKAILNAYLSGGYTLKEVGDYFGRHYSTISRIVKAGE
ncbi:REP-associated tyrosine transposase [Methyloprofundus sp.]|uniref:REP-associated tyrosine transposase n=1 Tax=Methyloprofundus sp. TaxID=2020875 RepID=UPI003D12CC09